ncbi:hypothetical protein LXL04_013560 [Taraxacum kok-saghyz]
MEQNSWPWTKSSTEKTMIPSDKVNEDETNLKTSDEKLSEINAKDDITKKQTSIAREAIQGWEKAETEVLALKQELEKATQQREALNECMLQIRFVREEQEKKIHGDLMKTSNEHEIKISELNKKVSDLELDNSQLMYALSSKEKTIDQLDYDLRSVVGQLESTQRENASLSYEVRVLEKELEIRNEEREFNRRAADVAHKQYLGSVKKIAQLETEAQRLRALLQKRLPGPADVAKMKNAVDHTRRRSNPLPIASKITFLTEQLCTFEEENRLLKEFLDQKSKSQTAATSSDLGSDEKTSMVESWAPSCNTVNASSDIGLMDDFVEMEKLALEDMKKNQNQSQSQSQTLEPENSNVNKSVQRLIEIIEGVKLCKNDDTLSNLSSPYTVHIFQWKLSEIREILDKFMKICNQVLNGNVGMEGFCKELTFALEWIVNHCFSLQDVSSMKDEIKKHFESEVEGGGPAGQMDKFDFPKDQLPGWPMAASWNVIVNDPIKTIDECSEVNQEHASLKEKEINTIPKEEIMTGNDLEKCELKKDEKALPSEKEIMEASEKLAECQETILNLGKQLKALSSSPDECEITVSPSPKRNSHQRISLLDKMITEDATGALRSQKSKGLDSNLTPVIVMSPKMFVSVDGVRDEKDEEALVNFLSIVPNKKKSGGGILRRLFGRKKGGGNNK